TPGCGPSPTTSTTGCGRPGKGCRVNARNPADYPKPVLRFLPVAEGKPWKDELNPGQLAALQACLDLRHMIDRALVGLQRHPEPEVPPKTVVKKAEDLRPKDVIQLR